MKYLTDKELEELREWRKGEIDKNKLTHRDPKTGLDVPFKNEEEFNERCDKEINQKRMHGVPTE